MPKQVIYESEYDDFSLYIVGPIVKNARAFVYDHDDDEWYHGYVNDIESVQIDDLSDRYTYAVNGDYTGEFISDDFDYYVGIETTDSFDMEKEEDRSIVYAIKGLKDYKLCHC